MRFVDRETELSELKQIEQLSKKKLFVAAVYGLRRVGKTRLLLEFLKGRGSYLFVNKNKTSVDLLNEFQAILKENQVLGKLEILQTWDDFFHAITNQPKRPIALDEFQNFKTVEPAVMGMLQKAVDLNEGRPGLIFLCGSQVGLMRKLFQNTKEPLYGRIKKKIKLNPLSISACFQFANELNLDKENLVKVYLLFGGYPKYYVALEDFGLQGKTAEEIVDAMFLAKDAPLEDEVTSTLAQEFGGRSGIYYSILEAIATGNNTLSAIASYLNMPATSITRQIQDLKEQFELIEQNMPYEGKRGQYRIRHPVMEFWFSQIYRQYSDYAARKPEFIAKVKGNLNAYYGRRFEHAATEFLIQELSLTQTRRQWGKNPSAEKGRNTYEIDLIAQRESTIFVFEFKWQQLDTKQAYALIEQLREKTRHVQKLARKTDAIQWGIVAKKIKGKDQLTKSGILAYDLDDF